MQFGLSLFATFILPLIMMISWLTCLWRLRSGVLLIITFILIGFILLSVSNPLLVTGRNPYLMLVSSGMLLFNIAVLPRIDETNRYYLIATNTTLLLMLLALHGWNIYLRQGERYFYEASDTATIAYMLIISIPGLALPFVAFFARPPR